MKSIGLMSLFPLNQDQYNEVVDVLSKLDSAKFDQTKILNKIIVSE